MTLYKLTEYNDYTQNNTFWGYNVEHRCKDVCLYKYGLHAYKTPIHAALFSYITRGYEKCWVAEGNVADFDAQVVVCTRLKTLFPCHLPHISDEIVYEMAKFISRHNDVPLRKQETRFYYIGYMYHSYLDVGKVYESICKRQ